MSRIVGDRCVILLLTETPWRWRRYLRAWGRVGIEWVVCSEVGGSGGLLTIAADHVGYNDLLAIVTDLDGMKLITDYGYSEPELPRCPIIQVSPSVLRDDITSYMARDRLITEAWAAQSWPALNTLIAPTPDGLVWWCVGWWAK